MSLLSWSRKLSARQGARRDGSHAGVNPGPDRRHDGDERHEQKRHHQTVVDGGERRLPSSEAFAMKIRMITQEPLPQAPAKKGLVERAWRWVLNGRPAQSAKL